MQVLVFGRTGQVARALARITWPQGVQLTFLDRQAADLSRPGELPAIVRQHRTNAVIIAAAYTAVDKAESEEALATIVNAEAPATIGRAAAALSIPVVHISTDYVFDGEKDGFYVEADPVGPIGAYGRSKLAGEVSVREANPRHLILRTSWVYDAAGSNFLRTMLRLAETGDEVRVVVDQQGCPTAAVDIAGAIAVALPAAMRESAKFGTYHIAGASSTSWHGFAEAIFDRLGARGLPRPRNLPIATVDYSTSARRPRNSRLSSEAFARSFGFRLRGFEAALPEILDEALGAVSGRGPMRREAAQ
jgi:dTDP-4-dehydrorhamnose reductase